MSAAGSTKEERALHVLTRVVSDSPFRARELIDRLCTGTRDAFGFKRVEWHPPHELVPVAREGDPPPDATDLSVLTALAEAAAAVAERARDVDDAGRLKDDFVSIASHELRAPIAVVHGIAATLHARVDDLQHDQVHALLGQLVVQTDRLRDLADQLLDLSRIERVERQARASASTRASACTSSCRGSPASAPPTCASWSSPATPSSPTRSRSSGSRPT